MPGRGEQLDPGLRVLASGMRKLGVGVSAERLRLFRVYYQELRAWNRRMNLTAIEDEKEVMVKHFLDSLGCIGFVDFEPGMKVVDVGSGAGFPGLVLAVVVPGLKVTLVEARAKRARFLEYMVGVLGLGDLEVAHIRAEDLGQKDGFREKFDRAVARAVAPMATLAEYCLPLLRVGGLMLAWKGPRVVEEMAGCEGGLKKLGGQVREIGRWQLPEGGGERTLVVVEKVAATPGKFPRRAGIPGKRPLW